MIQYFLVKTDFRFVYIMFNPRTGKTKIGISGNVEIRRNDIEKSIDGAVKILTAHRFFSAQEVEVSLHKRFQKYHAPMGTGSGRTEWFKMPFLVRLWLVFFLWLMYLEQIFMIFLILLGVALFAWLV